MLCATPGTWIGLEGWKGSDVLEESEVIVLLISVFSWLIFIVPNPVEFCSNDRVTRLGCELLILSRST